MKNVKKQKVTPYFVEVDDSGSPRKVLEVRISSAIPIDQHPIEIENAVRGFAPMARRYLVKPLGGIPRGQEEWLPLPLKVSSMPG